MTDRGPVHVDGSRGEGGGQILRTALTLSMLTGRPVRFERLRAGRPKPGLRPQHRVALRAAAKICRAEVEGGHLGSQEVSFHPGKVRPGRYRFEIPTAGSASLVIQTVALPLALAPKRSIVEVVGGTHVPWSPSAHYLSDLWAPWMRDRGLPVEVTLDLPGFFPEGGGSMRLRTDGGGEARPWNALERGDLRTVEGSVTLSNLPISVGQRIAASATDRIARLGVSPKIHVRFHRQARAAGVAIDVLARFDGGAFGGTSLGKQGRPSEEVGGSVADDLRQFVESAGTADPFLADQVVLPLALARGVSRFRASRATRHLFTNAATVALFLGERVELPGEEGEEMEVTVHGVGDGDGLRDGDGATEVGQEPPP